jgi:hypothetical protein
MYRLTCFVAAAMLVITSASEAATGKKKKPGASADRSSAAASKHDAQRVSRPAAQSRQGWPTSWSDGSFRFRD